MFNSHELDVAILLQFSSQLYLNIVFGSMVFNKSVDIRRHSFFLYDITPNKKFHTEFACRISFFHNKLIVALLLHFSSHLSLDKGFGIHGINSMNRY